MAADYLKREFISHTRQVCSLYKRMLRDVDFKEDDFFEGRFQKLIIRAEFDKYKKIKDMRKAKALLEDAEKDFFDKMDPYHKFGLPWHQFSKGGIAYGRQLLSPDWVMDYYHPLIKAQYPYYYAKREQMKDEYIKMWRKKVLKKPVEENKDEVSQNKTDSDRTSSH